MAYAKILNVINSAIISSFLSKEQQGSLSKQLTRIKMRINDNKIYLGIVGEFSTGKSTLINSFIVVARNFSPLMPLGHDNRYY